MVRVSLLVSLFVLTVLGLTAVTLAVEEEPELPQCPATSSSTGTSSTDDDDADEDEEVVPCIPPPDDPQPTEDEDPEPQALSLDDEEETPAGTNGCYTCIHQLYITY